MDLSTEDFDFVRKMVRTAAAIVVEPGKEYLVEARLTPLMRCEGYASLEEMIDILRKAAPGSSLVRKVVDVMTTNETSFFRDKLPFDVLKQQILPELIHTRRGDRRLNFWCGAASTGQEPYSLAMMIAESFPQLATWDLNFLATDLSQEVLEKARSGRYTQLEVNRGLPVSYLVKYFEKKGVQWELKESIRQTVEFREMNLIEAWTSMPRVDIVLMRNVLIYFDVDVKKQILSKVHDVLRPDGCLLLGGAETTINLDDRFHRAPHDRGGVYRLIDSTVPVGRTV